MMKNSFDKIFVIVFAICFYGFSLLCYIKPAQAVSKEERRKLTQMPDISVDNIISGQFMDKFEKYATDQIPFRQTLRACKSWFDMYAMGKGDIDRLYINDGYIVKQEYPLNEESLYHAADRFRYVYDKYLGDSRVYMSIIPDKNYYANGDKQLKMDYDKLVEIMCDSMEYCEYIDIFPQLSLRDYYVTDPHWKQQNIAPAANILLKGMGNKEYWEYSYVYMDKLFYGSYYGQLALPADGDKLAYTIAPYILSATAYDYQNNRDIWIYDLAAANGRDAYEMYLYGSLSLVTIDNQQSNGNRELIIFRDSFGSSIAPMLLSGYSRITLVDIRYISIDILGEYIDFNGKDVLFLYSTTVLNNSDAIK